MSTTLFVLPLDPKYVCSVHHGVLENPMMNEVGSVCAACNKNSLALPNPSLQEEINSLLCYCKYGITTVNGELVPIPNNAGCSHIVKYGSRIQHEATCEFKKESDNVASVPSYDGMSLVELRNMLQERDAKIAILQQQLLLRDAELNKINTQLNDTQNAATKLAKKAADNTKEMLDELVRVIAEDIPNSLSAARDSVVSSPGYHKTTEALQSFKKKMAVKAQSVGQQASDMHLLDKFIASLAELRDELVQNVKHVMDSAQTSPNSNANRSTSPTTSTSSPTPAPVPAPAPSSSSSSGGGRRNQQEEEELALRLSLATFEAEEESRRKLALAEQAALDQATQASLSAGSPSPILPAL